MPSYLAENAKNILFIVHKMSLLTLQYSIPICRLENRWSLELYNTIKRINPKPREEKKGKRLNFYPRTPDPTQQNTPHCLHIAPSLFSLPCVPPITSNWVYQNEASYPLPVPHAPPTSASKIYIQFLTVDASSSLPSCDNITFHSPRIPQSVSRKHKTYMKTYGQILSLPAPQNTQQKKVHPPKKSSCHFDHTHTRIEIVRARLVKPMCELNMY